MRMLLHNLEKAGATIHIVDAVNPIKKDKEALGALLYSADLIAYESTFVYADLNRQQALGLMKIPAKVIVGFLMGPEHESCSSRSLDLLKEREILEMPDHVLVDINGPGVYSDCFEVKTSYENDWEISYQVTELKDVKAKIQKEIDEEMAKYRNCRLTKNEVRILDVYALGKNWSNLKKDMVVREVDPDSFELPQGDSKGNPHRGVWVMGVEGPVKLLNDNANQGGKIEFTFETNTAECLLRELNSASEVRVEDPDFLALVLEWIKRAMTREKDVDDQEHFEFLRRTFKLERRFYRQHFMEKIRRHKNAHQHFFEK